MVVGDSIFLNYEVFSFIATGNNISQWSNIQLILTEYLSFFGGEVGCGVWVPSLLNLEYSKEA